MTGSPGLVCLLAHAYASTAVLTPVFGVLSHVLAGAVQNGLSYMSGRWLFESFEGKVKYLMHASVLMGEMHKCY